MTQAAEPFEWAVVCLAGSRRRIAGCVREEIRFGIAMLRIDAPVLEPLDPLDEPPRNWATFWFRGSAVFSIERVDAATVMAINAPEPSRLAAPEAAEAAEAGEP
jgi:hypothetical protein